MGFFDEVFGIGGFGEIGGDRKNLASSLLGDSAAVASNGSFRRAQMATSTPSRASARVIALPMPSLAPVTIAFLSRHRQIHGGVSPYPVRVFQSVTPAHGQ